MKFLLPVVCGLLLSLALPAGARAQTAADSPPAASHEAQETAARSAGEAWLAYTDGARYDTGYLTAAGIFQRLVTKDQWVKMVTAGRGPLGRMLSRKLKDAKFSPTMAGAPDGQYVVLHFDTVFEKKAAAVETLTTLLDTDGQWKVCGYFIR